MSDKPYGTRTFLELSVGRGSLAAELLVHLRRADLDWWNSDVSDHQAQLFRIIERRVLPVEFRGEIEGSVVGGGGGGGHRKRRRNEDAAAGGGGGVVIGEKNLERGGGGWRRGERNGGGAAAAEKKGGKRSSAAGGRGRDPGKKADDAKRDGGGGAGGKKSKGHGLGGSDITYLFGDTIQLTYKMEEVRTSESATLLYDRVDDDPEEGRSAAKSGREASEDDETAEGNRDGDRSEEGEKKRRRGGRKTGPPPSTSTSTAKTERTSVATFRRVEKLPRRIVVWCYRLDPRNPTEPNPEGGGFPRPELVPISSLFS